MDENVKVLWAMVEQHGIRNVLDGLLTACINAPKNTETALGRQLISVATQLNRIVMDLPKLD